MNTTADKTPDKSSQSNANLLAGIQEPGEAAVVATDNRSVSVAQRKLQEIANNSESVKQLQAVQHMANTSPQAQKAAGIVSMVTKNNTVPIQQKEDKAYTISDIGQYYSGNLPTQQSQPAQLQTTATSGAVIQMKKPGSKAEATALTTGNISRKTGEDLPAGQRHFGYHGGIELKQQLRNSKDTNIPSSFTEYDVNPKKAGQSRDAERIVVGDNGRIWYTNRHYAVGSFVEIK
jgi:hypothetical protein